MGLTIKLKGYDTLNICYSSFSDFRLELAEAYNKRLGELYNRLTFSGLISQGRKPLSDSELKEFKKLAGDLLIFLCHSDCDGSFIPCESKKIYKSFEKLETDCGINENNAFISSR